MTHKGKEGGGKSKSGSSRTNLLYLVLSAAVTFLFLMMSKSYILSALSSVSHHEEATNAKLVYRIPLDSKINAVQQQIRPEVNSERPDPSLQQENALVTVTSEDAAVVQQPPIVPKAQQQLRPLSPSSNSSLLSRLLHCPPSVHSKYTQVLNAEREADDRAWCERQKREKGVSVGRSWGSLSKR